MLRRRRHRRRRRRRRRRLRLIGSRSSTSTASTCRNPKCRTAEAAPCPSRWTPTARSWSGAEERPMRSRSPRPTSPAGSAIRSSPSARRTWGGGRDGEFFRTLLSSIACVWAGGGVYVAMFDFETHRCSPAPSVYDSSFIRGSRLLFPERSAHVRPTLKFVRSSHPPPPPPPPLFVDSHNAECPLGHIPAPSPSLGGKKAASSAACAPTRGTNPAIGSSTSRPRPTT